VFVFVVLVAIERFRAVFDMVQAAQCDCFLFMNVSVR